MESKAPWTSPVAWALFGVTAVLVPAAVVLAGVGRSRGLDLVEGSGSRLLLVGLGGGPALLFAAVGLVVVRAEPRNAIGWIFLGSASLLAVNIAAYGYADLVVFGGEPWPAGPWAAWLTYWTFIVGVFVCPALVAQLFPGGRPLPGAWRWVFWIIAAYASLSTLVAALNAGASGSYPGTASPVSAPGALGDLAATLDNLGTFAAPPVFLVSAAALVVRFRRSTGAERQQMKWLASAGAVPVTAFAVSFVTGAVFAEGPLLSAIFIVGFASLMLIPVAVGIAISRYRLYEIDRLISKTLVYASLTVVLGAAYVALVLAGQAVFSSFAGGSNLAIAASTLVVAALFLPVRGRLQRFVDRRFYRQRYDAGRTLEAFGSRLRREVELGTLVADLRGAVDETTMQPEHAAVWLRGAARR